MIKKSIRPKRTANMGEKLDFWTLKNCVFTPIVSHVRCTPFTEYAVIVVLWGKLVYWLVELKTYNHC